MNGKVILIPIALAEDGYDALPASIATAINACQVFFAENLRTARRAFKKIDKSFDYTSENTNQLNKFQTINLLKPLIKKLNLY